MKVTVDLPDEFVVDSLRDTASTIVGFINDVLKREKKNNINHVATDLQDYFADLAALNKVIEYYGGDTVNFNNVKGGKV